MNPMTDLTPIARELMRLLDERDCRAYDVVGAVQAVLTFWEAQDFNEVEKHLRQALEQFHQADKAVNEFTNTLQPPKKGSQYEQQKSAAAEVRPLTPKSLH